MKIVMIHGQNHKGSTYNVGRMIAKKSTVKRILWNFFFLEI